MDALPRPLRLPSEQKKSRQPLRPRARLRRPTAIREWCQPVGGKGIGGWGGGGDREAAPFSGLRDENKRARPEGAPLHTATGNQPPSYAPSRPMHQAVPVLHTPLADRGHHRGVLRRHAPPPCTPPSPRNPYIASTAEECRRQARRPIRKTGHGGGGPPRVGEGGPRTGWPLLPGGVSTPEPRGVDRRVWRVRAMGQCSPRPAVRGGW